jgi:RNA polymerase subunit RPABC4/transcription elongation factor Spt4
VYILALINCPECNKEISDKVKVCPNCGYPFEDEEVIVEQEKSNSLNKLVNNKKMLYIITGIILLIIVSGTVYYQQIIKPKQLYESAIALLEKGNYEDANKMLSKITDYKDVKTIQKQIKYESIVYTCINDFKKYLKNPDSLQMYEVTFYEDAKKPTCVIEYGAQNGFGGNNMGYALFSAEDHTLIGTCDTLDKSEIDLDEYSDLITCIAINVLQEDTPVGEVDLSRIKTVLKNEAYSTIKIIE